MEASTGIAQGQLRSIVERIERLEEEKATITEDIKEVYAEAKANGFDTKILRKVVRLRKVDRAEREEEEALIDLYLHALGMAIDPTAAGSTPSAPSAETASDADAGPEMDTEADADTDAEADTERQTAT